MIKIDNCDIYELGGLNYEESLVISDVAVEIIKNPDELQQGVRVLRGGSLRISPKTIDAHKLSPSYKYEIRSKDGLQRHCFQPSQFGIPIEHGSDFTMVKIK